MRGTLATTVGLLAVAARAATKNSTCADGLYIIAARGSGEPTAAGPHDLYPADSGSAGYVANLVAEQVKGTKIEGVDYPATIDHYENSEDDGAKSMLDLATEYHSSCPNGKMALIGYSQGAQLVSDLLCGGTGGDFNHDKPISKDIAEGNIVAAVLFGDPTHIANTSYDVGTSKNDGIFPRKDTSACKGYTFMKSWCDTGDIYCDSGDNTTVHGLYLQNYNSTMVKFIVDQWKAASSSKPSATKTPSAPSSTATGNDKGGAASALGPARNLLLGVSAMMFALWLS